MMKNILNYMQLKKVRFLELAGIIAIAFMAGTLIHDAILFFVADEAEEVFLLGAMMMVMVIAVIGILIEGMMFSTDFNHAVSMGQTRKTFLVLDAATELAMMLILSFVVQLLYLAEVWKLRILYPNHSVERLVEPLMGIGHFQVFVVLMTALGLLIGAMIQRFGKAAFWVIWVLWMATCIGGPRLVEVLEQQPDNSVVQVIVNIMSHVSGPGLLTGIGLILSAVMLAVYGLLLHRQQVNL